MAVLLRRRSGDACRDARIAALAAACTVALSGCSGGVKTDTALPRSNSSAYPTPSRSSAGVASPSATPNVAASPSASPGNLVAGRYLEFLKVVAQAGATSNPDDPRLIQYATGAVLLNLRGRLTVRRQAGTHLEGAPAPHIQSVLVTGSRASVRDCLDNSRAWLVDRRGKKLAVGRARQETTSTLLLQNGGWKVSEVVTVAGGGAC